MRSGHILALVFVVGRTLVAVLALGSLVTAFSATFTAAALRTGIGPGLATLGAFTPFTPFTAIAALIALAAIALLPIAGATVRALFTPRCLGVGVDLRDSA